MSNTHTVKVDYVEGRLVLEAQFEDGVKVTRTFDADARDYELLLANINKEVEILRLAAQNYIKTIEENRK